MTTMVEFRTVVLNVVLHCEGCARTVKRAIKRIPGASISLSLSTQNGLLNLLSPKFMALQLQEKWIIIKNKLR